MATILDKILTDTRQELARRKADTPLETFKDKALSLPKCRNFCQAVTKKNPRGLNVIAEVKKASP